MNNKSEIPNVEVQIPDYPNWKKGFLWGFIWSMPVFWLVLFTQTKSEPPFPEGFDLILYNLIPAIFFFSIPFIIIGVLVAFKPIRNKKDNEPFQRTANRRR